MSDHAVTDQLRELKITHGGNIPTEVNGVSCKDSTSAASKEDETDPDGIISTDPGATSDQGLYRSHSFEISNETTKPTANGAAFSGSANQSGTVGQRTANGDMEAKTNGVPDTRINGELEEEHVNTNIMGPEDEDDGDNHPLLERDTASVGRKTKKKKPKSKRGLNAPTGFEEFYVDAPLTPAEHEEEKGIYHNSVPFRERIEIAIQRFFAKRNLNSERKDVFDKYLAYGGVDSGQKMFSGGLDYETLSNRTAPEIATMTAKHSVGQDKDDSGNSMYVVDFDGVAKAFLSSQLPLSYDLWNQEAIKLRVAVVRNFLNYLLHHDVCPEYNSQIYAARDSCDQADKELWLVVQASRLLPGKFNTACSEIFGGFLQGLYIGDKDWAKGFKSDGPGISAEMARKTFKTGLIARASEETLKLFKKQDDANKIKIMSETETGLEVTELISAEEEVLELYESAHGKGLKPLGRLKAKTWYFPGAPDEDLTDEDLTDEEDVAAASATQETKEYEFWVEDEVLQKCFVGMKFITVVKELSFGVLYFDSLLGVYCSFYEVLPNEEMIGWREPEKTWLPMREKVEFENMEGEEAEDDGKSAANEDVTPEGAGTTGEI